MLRTDDDEPGLAKNETKVIFWMKFVALACLIAVGVGMTWLTYALSREQESSSFESAFNDQASRLIDAFYANTINQMWIASTMGLALSSQEGVFPCITVPKLEAIGFGQLQLVRGSSFAWAPLLNNQTEKKTWENYAINSSKVAGYSRLTYSSMNTIKDPMALSWPGRDIGDGIFEFYNGNWPAKRQGAGPYSPVWQIAPIATTRRAVMFDQFSEPIRAKALTQMLELKQPVLTSLLNEDFEDKITSEYRGPRSILFSPLEFANRTVGSIQIEHEWKRVFEGISEESFVVVLSNTCGETVSFQTNGPTVDYIGPGDRHSTTRVQSSSDAELQRSWESFFVDVKVSPEQRDEFFIVDAQRETHDSTGRPLCMYSIKVYPAQGFEDQFFTLEPVKQALVVSMVFVFCVMVFVAYNYMVERRQRKILDTLVRSKAVINSLFPPTFRDRLFTPKKRRNSSEETRFLKASPKIRLTSMLNDTTLFPEGGNSGEEPIAEMFSNTTVIFADIAGFSAWSSQREPYQVFKLLETIYAAFDSVARSLSVFKVETIGDCYVAVTGLPTPQEDHAILMATFAVEILERMAELTKELEITLGPGTADLGLRVGLHSGTVIAGVLRGEKSRFQLFGDTMNCSSRMESTGTPGKVQISQETADLIVAARKGNWLVKRRQAVEAKGLGLLQTYWLNPLEMKNEGRLSSIRDLHEVKANDTLVPAITSQKWGHLGLESSITARKLERLVDWNVEVLLTFLTKIVENRKDEDSQFGGQQTPAGESTVQAMSETSSIVSEVTEVIHLPPFTRQKTKASRSKKDSISHAVRMQLRDFVFRIASGYRDVPFHNFEHASHVALSANKLMKRIISPDEVGNNHSYEKKKVNNKEKMEAYESDLHNSTFGISSDALTQFSIVFAALVHDVEHYGVPNSQLVKEQHHIAVKYGNKSVAEQHSVDLALAILSEPSYRELQACMYHSEGEKLRFRQLLINSVLATDIVDQELRLLRKNRWTKAFSEPNQILESNEDANRKATIVLEHIIQASDVAHTMQHWHIFCKWNEKLYQEMYIAYLDGRADKDPSDGWYEGEIGFFDHYIIPLARNLKDCGVFGVSSDEYLMYALANRDEWKIKGKAITARMVSRKDKISQTRGQQQAKRREEPTMGVGVPA